MTDSKSLTKAKHEGKRGDIIPRKARKNRGEVEKGIGTKKIKGEDGRLRRAGHTRQRPRVFLSFRESHKIFFLFSFRKHKWTGFQH